MFFYTKLLYHLRSNTKKNTNNLWSHRTLLNSEFIQEQSLKDLPVSAKLLVLLPPRQYRQGSSPNKAIQSAADLISGGTGLNIATLDVIC